MRRRFMAVLGLGPLGFMLISTPDNNGVVDAAVLTPSSPHSSAVPPQLQASPSQSSSGAVTSELVKPSSDAGEVEITTDPFAPKSWVSATPPVTAQAVPPAPPPAPVAPPLPFRLVGVLENGTAPTTYYLANQTQEFPVQLGETFEGVYRLESVKPHELVFTYLPMNTTQTLAIAQE